MDHDAVKISFANVTPNIKAVTVDKPTVKRRKFGPYVPYPGQMKLNVSVAVVLNKDNNLENKSVNNCRDQKDYVDFAVEQSSEKNPRLVEPDELHVIEFNNFEKDHIKTISARCDLTETSSNNLELLESSHKLVPNFLSIKKEVIDPKDYSEFLPVDITTDNNESSTVQPLQTASENKTNGTITTDRDEFILSTTVSPSNSSLSLNETKRQDLLKCGKDLHSSTSLVDKHPPLLNGKIKSTLCQTKRKCNRHFCEAYHVLPFSINLDDIKLTESFKHKYFLSKALHKIADAKINEDLQLPKKDCNQIINVTTDASSPVVCQSFEEAVALKLAEKRKLFGSTDISKSPCKIESATVVLSPSANSAKNCKKSIEDSSKTLESCKEFSNKTLTPSDISYYNEMLAKNSCIVPRPSNIPDSISSCGSTSGTQLNATMQKTDSPVKGKRKQSLNSRNDRALVTKLNEKALFELPQSISVESVSSTATENDVDVRDCEAVRSVPLHPRIRMKLKSHSCNCTAEHCSYTSPSMSPTKIRRNTFTGVQTKILKNDLKEIVPTSNSDIDKTIVSISRISSTPFCNILSSPHPRNSPSIEVAKIFVFNQDYLNSSKTVTPTKRSNRPSLLPTPSPKSSRSKLSWSINRGLLESEFDHDIKEEMDVYTKEKEDLVAVDSDTLTASSCENENPTVVHISSDSELEIENDDEKESYFVPVLKREKDFYDKQCDMEEEDTCIAIQPGERRQRKSSSKNRIESFISKPKIAPTLLKASDIGEMDIPVNSTGRLIKTVSKRQMIKLSRYFKLHRVTVSAIKLNETTIRQLIDLCTVRKIWKNPELLAKAGLSAYDIQRLCLSKLRSQSNSKYGFRKFLKRTDVFQSLLEKPKLLGKSRRELFYLKSQKKKMKELVRAKEREERQRQDIESIRRSLLKINAKFLNQSKFWSFLDQGTPGKPIKL